MTGQPGDGFDLEYGEENKRFHEHYETRIEGGVQRVEDAYLSVRLRAITKRSITKAASRTNTIRTYSILGIDRLRSVFA
jgi:hypothetical protein